MNLNDLAIADRGVYRKKLVGFLARVTTVPKVVLPYMPANTKLQSPIVAVTSAPTDRKRMSPVLYDNSFAFSVRLVTLYSVQSDTSWTPEMAEDMLDRLELEISRALLLADMQSEANGWTSITRQGDSQFDMLNDSGAYYLTETIPVVMEVDDG